MKQKSDFLKQIIFLKKILKVKLEVEALWNELIYKSIDQVNIDKKKLKERLVNFSIILK